MSMIDAHAGALSLLRYGFKSVNTLSKLVRNALKTELIFKKLKVKGHYFGFNEMYFSRCDLWN